MVMNNIQGTFREHSGIYKEHLGNIGHLPFPVGLTLAGGGKEVPGDGAEQHSGKIQGTFMEH